MCSLWGAKKNTAFVCISSASSYLPGAGGDRLPQASPIVSNPLVPNDQKEIASLNAPAEGGAQSVGGVWLEAEEHMDGFIVTDEFPS